MRKITSTMFAKLFMATYCTSMIHVQVNAENSFVDFEKSRSIVTATKD